MVVSANCATYEYSLPFFGCFPYTSLRYPRRLNLPHVQYRPDAVALLHNLEGVVDLAQRLAVGDELVDLQLAVQVVLDEAGQLRPALDAAEGTSLPLATSDELECYRGTELATAQIVHLAILTRGRVRTYVSSRSPDQQPQRR